MHSSEGWMMGRFLSVIGATVGGGVGWWLGGRFGMMTAFLISTLGTALGVYAARRLTQNLLS